MGILVQGKNSSVCAHNVKSKVPYHVVLSILLVDLVHLDCDLPVLIHCEDVSNVPMVVLLTHFKDVFFKHIVVISKVYDLVHI